SNIIVLRSNIIVDTVNCCQICNEQSSATESILLIVFKFACKWMSNFDSCIVFLGWKKMTIYIRIRMNSIIIIVDIMNATRINVQCTS
ncbi:hypothetical protein ACJX0J_025602, partial [Zea mays]